MMFTIRMSVARLTLLFVLCTLLFNTDGQTQKVLKRSKRNHVNCGAKSLVRYMLTVHTTWSKEVFPKMFPTYRPHAQWSLLVGRAHGSGYQMWAEGANATAGVKLFAELGESSQLDMESVQGYDDVLDSFVAPPVNKSVGQTSTVIILDGHHSKISFMMKIIPSPDWFVGVSSLDLCAHGRWKNKVHVDLRPYDAGTDQGLTFTAPNWPNTPAEPISAITSSYPDHPASSFFYPEYEELPRLGYLELDIVSEFRHRANFVKVPHHYVVSSVENVESENDKRSREDEKSTPSHTADNKQHNLPSDAEDKSRTNKNENNNQFISAVGTATIATNRRWISLGEVKGNGLAIKPVDDKKTHIHIDNESMHRSTTETEHAINYPAQNIIATTGLEEGATPYVTTLQYNSTQTRSGNIISVESSVNVSNQEVSPKSILKNGDLLRESSLFQRKADGSEHTTVAMSDSTTSLDESLHPGTSTRRLVDIYGGSSVDCEVGEWSEWSPCSQTCGFGQQERSRGVSRYPENGGANCPRLRQTNWCGSMRSCQWNHFSFLEPETPKRQLREGPARRRRTKIN